VRAHGDVLAAAPRPDAEQRLEMIFALLQRGGGDDQVIELRVRNVAQRADGRSSAAKSSSTLAPLGS
jgi:hypothetical protein